MTTTTANANATTSLSSGREEIVDKLHVALAAFRRERDDVHRKKELAVERLRLVKDECEALTKTVRAMQSKLRELQGAVSSEEAKREVEVLQQEVERLNRETQFQHTELLSKKENLAGLESNMGDTAKTLNNSLRATREALRLRRDKMSTALPSLTPQQQLEKMKKESEEVDNEERLWPKWPRLVQETAAALTMEVNNTRQSSDGLRKILEGYKKHFGDMGMQPVATMGQ